MTIDIATADVLEWARTYDGPKFHAMLCDPPYHLTDIERTYQAKAGSVDPRTGRERSNQRRAADGGFMGKQWDGGDVAFDPATWAALAEHLHPGAFIMAFASSRGWHRLAVAIEDAGLRIHPSIFGWAFGSGFPKATRVKDAPDFEGHRYGGQALKPALEPIIVAQVPYVGKPRDSIVATGAGALWVDGGRVATGGETLTGGTGTVGKHEGWDRPYMHDGSKRENYRSTAGRWPPNFVLSHLETCNGVCAPECPVRRLGEQSGERVGAVSNGSAGQPGATWAKRQAQHPGHADTGTAARFFPNHDYALDIAERIAAADPVAYVAKASRRERNAGCEGLPEVAARNNTTQGNGSGDHRTMGRASSIEKQPLVMARNPHPTVKPLALARWLATLLLPPAAYAPRRILIPFSGSGSEMIGAMLAGWEDVQGIEGEAEYVAIARARLAWWAANRDKAPEVRAGEPYKRERNDERQTASASPVYGQFNGRANASPAPMLPGLEAAP